MTSFKSSKDQTENTMMLKLLSNVEADPNVTQRNLSKDLNIAFGLVNTYLKRCVKKGWVRAKAVSPKRYLYFITPEGFKEKSRIISQYLSDSMTFFRDAREQFEQAFDECSVYSWKKMAFLGDGDLAHIGELVARSKNIKIDIINEVKGLKKYDAIFITDIINPQSTFDKAKSKIDERKIITIDLLHISRNKNVKENQA